MKQNDRRVRIATYLAALNIAAGLTVLAGWQYRLPPLKFQSFGTFVSPNTAVCFILCGCSLLLQVWVPQRKALYRFALLLAGVVTLFSAATLLEYLLNVDLGIDRLVMAHRLHDWTLPTPGRFAANSAVGFLFAGLGLLTLRREKGTPVSEIFACLVFLVAYQSLLGYVYSAAVLYAGVMALPTIFLFVILAVALLCAASRQFVLDVLASPYAGAVASRRMLMAIALLLPALAFVELRVEKAGLVSLGTGTAISTIVAAALFTVLAIQTAAALNESEQKRQQTEFERNRAGGLLAAIVDSSDDAIISKNLDGIITSWNKSAEQLFGYTAAEATGQHITLIIPPERRKEEETIISRLRRGERVDHFETVRVRKDGTTVDLSLTISPVKDADGKVVGASKVARDISERKRVERALRESEERLRAIVETTPECVKIVAADGTLRHMNPAGLAMVGADSAEMVAGKNVYDLIAPEDRDRFRAFNELICNGQRGSLEYEIIGLSGVRRQMETHGAPLEDIDGTIAQLAVSRDITERKGIEERLRKTEKIAAAGQLAASLAHEINNPLSSVINALYLLKHDSALDARTRDLVSMASSELSRMSRIVNQSLAYYRQGTSPTNVDMGGIVEESVQVFADKFERVGIHLRKKVAAGNHVVGFAGEIRQVVDNLLLNAVEAMPHGGSLTISVRQSRDWKDESRRGVRLTIADTGCGIPRAILSRIFEPFFTTKPEKGTGLGLWVAQGLVLKHEGRMRVRSSDNHGKAGTAISILWPSSTSADRESTLARAESVA